jgi:acetyltransferase-like isoleucine patch superfamily enzyme
MTRLAELGAPPYKGRRFLAWMSEKGYVSSRAAVHHPRLRLGNHVFIGDEVQVVGGGDSGEVRIGDGAHIHRDCIIETGQGGGVRIGADTHVQPRCQLSAYVGAIEIGSGVQIAPNCGFYPYNHGMEWGRPIKGQPLISNGPIVVEDDAWLGFGVVVLENVRIGEGAVVGAGSVVARSVPPGAVAVGQPARVVRMRDGTNPPEFMAP